MDLGNRALIFERCSQRAQTAGRALSDWLGPDPARARYRLGAGPEDWRLPYTLGEDLRQQVRSALAELACLYVSRNRQSLGQDTYDTLLLQAEPSAAVVGPALFAAPESVTSDTARMVLRRAAAVLPGLDAGVLVAWWGGQGRGRGLLQLLTGLFGQAMNDMRASARKEQTPCWLALALFGLAAEAAEGLKRFDLHPAVRAELETVSLCGLLFCHYMARGRVRELHPPHGEQEEDAFWIWAALLSPRTAFGPRAALAAGCRFGPVDPVWLGEAGPELIDRLDRTGWGAAAEWLTRHLKRDDTAQRRAERALAADLLADQVLDLLAAGGQERRRLSEMLIGSLKAKAGLSAWLADRDLRKQQIKALLDAADRSNPGVARRLKSLAQQLKRYSERSALKSIAFEGEARALVVRHFLVAAAERLVDRVAARARERLSERTGEETDRDLSDLYESGRLYHFGADERPFLQEFQHTAEVGHYFIDVKDFTRRTTQLKEEVMADFIRREFYAPILALAGEHYHGLSQLADRGGIHLNNLLGDAVSLSGDVVALVQVARRIRAHLEGYAEGLASRLSGGDGGRPVLQAGSFISYGAAPAVVTFDDPIWGAVRVSIAEKINESARGTARAGPVLGDLLAQLDQLRARLDRPGLALPFRVYVGQPTGLPIPAAEDLEIRGALAAGDPSAAMAIYQRVAADHIRRQLGRVGASQEAGLARSAALYNAGDALSQGAFEAYRRAMEGRLRFVQLRLEVARLPGELVERFAFFEPEELIVAALAPDQPLVEELFRFAGQAVFKGFEAIEPVGVWEMLPAGDPVFRALAALVAADA